MDKADAALVQRVIDAALAVIGDPALRARLVPDAIDDVDPNHLELRISLFENMGQMQRMLLSSHRLLAERSPAPPSADRARLVAAARAAAERFTPDRAAIEALFAVAHQLPDEKLVALARDLDKLADVQARDLEILFRMDETREARAQAATERPKPTTAAERLARMQQMKADLEEKNRALKEKLEAMRK